VIRLRALGQCVIEVGAHSVTPESDVLFALLLLLSSSAGRAVARSDVLELLWPESAPNSARHRLRQALYQLKKLGAPVVTPDSVIAVRASDVEVDYATYAVDRQAVARSVGEASSLEYLPHYAPSFSPRFARWVEAERDRVRATLRRFLLDSITEARARGEHAEVVALARACLDLDPLNGEATFALAESLAVQGSRAEALGLLDQYRDERSGDAEVSRATAALRRRIVELARRPSSSMAGEAPLTGRADIVADLASWIASGAQRARILAFSGEPGIGKTRLLKEGVRIATLRGLRCVEYRPSAAGGERPLAGLLDLLPQLLTLPGAVGCSPESYSRLSDLARGVHADTSVPEDRTDSAFRFATLRRSVLDLIEAILAEGELLIVIDDAHALDRPTLEILIDATACRGYRLAMLVAMRAAGAAPTFLEGRPDVRIVRVPRLEPADARLIVMCDLAPEIAAQRSKMIDWAVDLANGNPFFLVELSAHCRGENPGESLPESLQTALDRKIDALSPSSRLVLQSCAVLGDHSTFARLEAMLGLAPHVTATALSELETAGLIALRDGRVVCRHDLIAEAVFRSVNAALGSYLHRRCAGLLDEELRSSPSSPSASLAWDCARHWDAADEHARALELTGLIVDQLLYLGLPKEAADLCARAERYCRTPEQHADRLLKLSRAHRLLYDWERVVASLVQRRAVLAGVPLRAEKYSEDEIALFEARWWRDCDGQVLRPALRRVLDRRAPTLHRLQMAVLALIVADNQYRRREAETIAEVVEFLDVATPREDAERCKARLIYHTGFGSLDAARASGARLLVAERRGGNSAALLRALRWISVPMRFSNDARGAVAVLTEAYEQASRLGLRGEMWNAAYCLAGVALEYEDLELARNWAPIVASLAEDATAYALRASEHHYTRARIEFMEGNYELAREELGRSITLKDSIPRTRGEQSILALDVLLRVQGHQRVPHATVARFRKLHLRTRDSGVWDFETAGAIAAVLYSGNRREALDLSDYYMRVRRSRLPTHSALRAVQTALTAP
jgi:DNA-binding SARP family transcriptional activator